VSNIQWHNPVQVFWGNEALSALATLVANREPVLITDPVMVKQGRIEQLEKHIKKPFASVWSDINPNPSIASCTKAWNKLNITSENVIIALGGGSVIDTAKCLSAWCGVSHAPSDWLATHLRESKSFDQDFTPAGLIAIPTTAGTGSEVTMWATVWDEISKKKHSLSNPSLYPEAALLFSEFTLSLPREITIFTALDAMSHAMESIWNKNSNIVSETLALRAIKLIYNNLVTLTENLNDNSLRKSIQYASLLSGLAFSTTRTALAHSISYPLTSIFKVPHGLACSFTLPEILKLNAKEKSPIGVQISKALNSTTLEGGVASLYHFFAHLDISNLIDKYIDDISQIATIEESFITPGRADNNLAQVTDMQARDLLLKAYKRLKETF